MKPRRIFSIVIPCLILLAGLGYGIYRFVVLTHVASDYRSENAGLHLDIEKLQADLASSTAANADLTESLRTAQKKNESFDEQLRELSTTVGDLSKLSKTDPELLTKYSKVFFLSDNYAPARLADIPSDYVSASAVRTPLSFQTQALPYLESMLDAAKEDGVDLQVISAYRSFGTQAQLKSSYKVTYGKGANSFSADQGYSEHQLGTTVDLTTLKTAGTFTGFDKTTSYAWLTDNAYRYGFILSYPAGNTYYQYEPWHWRFVGTSLARYLHNEHKRFYDLDQREINNYLGTIFD